jgi:serine/threonine protein kinase
MPLSSGQVVASRYAILEPLGAGGMGAVYRAWDTRLNAPVALKEMVPQPGLAPQALDALRRQFQQEATVLANLDHAHLVDVLDFFAERGNAYLVMRFVAGESLGARIRRLGPLRESEVLIWADQLLDVLTYCHARGVLHRDIKPQNVVIRPDGQAVLVDFGLVKLWDPRDPRTQTAMRGMGTPEYAPLEQYDASAGHTDQRSDLYSLGATLYHALTGRVPPTITSRILDPKTLTPPRAIAADLLPSTEAAILRAMEVHPGNRFGSANEMRAELARGLARPSIATAPGSPAPAVASVQSTGPQVAPQPVASAAEQPFAAQPAPEIAQPSPADRRANTLAITSLVLGILSLSLLLCYFSGGLFGIAALVTGLASRRRFAGGPGSRKRARMALAGLVMGIMSIVISVGALGILGLAALIE